MSPAPTARQSLPLVPEPRAVCLRLLPFPCRFTTPFDTLGLKPGPYWTEEVYEPEHVSTAIKRLRVILDAKYEKENLYKIM